MSNKLTPYELATLASRISPDLCSRTNDQERAIAIASSLVEFAERSINRYRVWSESREEADRRMKEHMSFLEPFSLGPGKENAPFKKAALIITGRIGADRHTGRAVEDFEKLVRLEGRERGEDAGGPYDPDPVIARFKNEGLHWKSVIYWREQAERNGFCSKKVLTDDLRKPAENDAEASVKAAEKSQKSAVVKKKSAAKRR